MDAGYWLLFDRITYDTGRLRYRLDSILKTRFEVDLTKIRVKHKLLEKYCKKKDRSIYIENHEKGLKGNTIGLLAEFLGDPLSIKNI